MSVIRTDYQRFHLAEQFYESFTEAAATAYYIFIGKASSWPNEPASDIPVSSFYQNDRVHWNEMIGGEKVAASDVSFCIQRIDWNTGETYTQYDDQESQLFSKNFYVLTDQYNVYKCIGNNNGGTSTVKPTGTGTSIISTADGYRWKYMYTITTDEATKFLGTSFMPVKTLTTDTGADQWDVQQAAIDGGIHRIAITSGGTGYNTTAPTVTIKGNGTGATATASISGGVVTGVTIVNAGSGYTFAEIIFSGGSPAVPAIARPVHAPKGGHGKNAVTELGGFYVMLRAELTADEGGTLPTVNDYRKIGVLKDPIDSDTGLVSALYNFDQTLRLDLLSGYTGTFNIDEIVTGATSGAKGRVVHFDTVSRTVHLNELSSGTFLDAENVSSNSGTGQIDNITAQDFVAGSGQILYVDQRSSISRAANQKETIKAVFEF